MKLFVLLFLLPVLSIAQNQSLETVLQKGHELAVVSVALSADSSFLATGSRDKSVKLWELSTGREARSFLGHEMTVTCVAFSHDGKFLISGSNDKTIRIWDITTGKSISVLETNDYISDIALDVNMKFLIAASHNDSGYPDSAMIFDFKTKKLIKRIMINTPQEGASVAISPDGKLVGFGEDDRTVNIYEMGTWKKINKFVNEDGGQCGGCPTQLAFNISSKILYMGSSNGPVKKYDLASSKLLKTYEQNEDDLNGLAISPDGRKFARATEKDITVWDEFTGDIIAKVESPEKGEFHEITFTLDSKKIIVTSDDNTAFALNIKTNKKEQIFTGFVNARDLGGLNYDPNFYWQSHIAKYVRLKNSLLITTDGKSLLKGKFGAKVKRWAIGSGKNEMEYVGHKKGVLSYALSKDGKRLLTGGGDGKIMVWDVASGDSLQSIQVYQEPIFDIQFNSDETQVVSSSWDATMRIHDLKTAKQISYFDLDNNSAYNILLHPNDLYAFTARLNFALELWEIDTRKVVRDFVGHTNVISTIRLSADQKSLLSSSWDGSIRLWDIATGLMTKKFKGHIGAVHTAIFNPEGTSIYSAGADRRIRVWDINTGKVIRTFEGHNSEVTSLLFSPDNKMLISHSVDGVTKFWDLATGKEFFEHIHFGERDWMVKSPEGYFNGTPDARKYIHFVSGTKTYSVDQFFHEFYRPDLLPKIFQNRGGKDNLKDIQGKLKSSPPPTVKVAVLPVSPGKAEVMVRITDNGAGAENLRVFHNGKSIALNRDELKLPKENGQHTIYKHAIELVGGTNTFTATASNKDKIESDTQSAEIFSDHSSKNSTCYILSVGINKYKNPRMALNYAKPDAESFNTIMTEKGVDLFKKVELINLYDDDATREKILSTIDELISKMNQEDVFIFFYAGHGSMVDDKFYFIPTESLRLYDASSLSKDAIEASLLQDKFKNIKALKQLIVMDACQSGGSVELLATRGASEEKAIAQLSRSAGIHVMASAGSEQFATEFAELGHGLFTYVLIKALSGEADGAPKDGKVTIYELKSYIDDQVPEMTRKLKGKPQYPYTFSRGQDFPVVIEK